MGSAHQPQVLTEPGKFNQLCREKLRAETVYLRIHSKKLGTTSSFANLVQVANSIRESTSDRQPVMKALQDYLVYHLRAEANPDGNLDDPRIAEGTDGKVNLNLNNLYKLSGAFVNSKNVITAIYCKAVPVVGNFFRVLVKCVNSPEFPSVWFKREQINELPPWNSYYVGEGNMKPATGAGGLPEEHKLKEKEEVMYVTKNVALSYERSGEIYFKTSHSDEQFKIDFCGPFLSGNREDVLFPILVQNEDDENSVHYVLSVPFNYANAHSTKVYRGQLREIYRCRGKLKNFFVCLYAFPTKMDGSFQVRFPKIKTGALYTSEFVRGRYTKGFGANMDIGERPLQETPGGWGKWNKRLQLYVLGVPFVSAWLNEELTTTEPESSSYEIKLLPKSGAKAVFNTDPKPESIRRYWFPWKLGERFAEKDSEEQVTITVGPGEGLYTKDV